ncbi:hypothetical protein BKA82DRAFT_4205743 [Pisolithus tinctorius]|nr:hypothetical protein BKA82DRAFT_4205743 [Pisolithus tinctorius]
MTAALHRLYAVLYRPIYLEGSIADLDWNSIRDAAGCTNITRKWIQMAIEYLEPADQNELYRLLDECHPCHFSSYSAWNTSSRESCRISYSEQVLTENIVAFFTQMDSTRGVQAFRFLLQLGVGMEFEICSTFISSLHPSGDPSPLHDLVIPRRWIMNPNKLSFPRSIIRRFLYCTRYLMNLLRSGKAHMKFDLPVNEESFVDIMLARMRRVLCILGYNVCDVGLSKTIAEILQLADLRVEYLKEIQALHHGSVIKDLIHLVHKDSRHPTPSISPRIPQLVFGKVVDISHQMNRAPAF